MPHNHPGSSRKVSLWKIAGLPILLLLFAIFPEAKGQNIPKMGMPAMPSLPTRELPNPSADLPNREMLQEAKQARQRYAELNRRYAQLKKEEADSTLVEEEFLEFRNELSTFLEGQKARCSGWASGMDGGHVQLANVLGYHGNNLDFQIRTISEAVSLRETGDMLQLSERNFRSLFDEHLYSLFGDPLEGHLLQNNTQGFRGNSGFYERGMHNLLRPGQMDKEAVASGFNTGGAKALGERIPVKQEQAGRLQSIKQKLGDINPFRPYANTDSTGGRFSMGLHYGVMRSWSEQVFAHTHIGYRMTGGTELFGGFVIKKD